MPVVATLGALQHREVGAQRRRPHDAGEARQATLALARHVRLDQGHRGVRLDNSVPRAHEPRRGGVEVRLQPARLDGPESHGAGVPGDTVLVPLVDVEVDDAGQVVGALAIEHELAALDQRELGLAGLVKKLALQVDRARAAPEQRGELLGAVAAEVVVGAVLVAVGLVGQLDLAHARAALGELLAQQARLALRVGLARDVRVEDDQHRAAAPRDRLKPRVQLAAALRGLGLRLVEAGVLRAGLLRPRLRPAVHARQRDREEALAHQRGGLHDRLDDVQRHLRIGERLRPRLYGQPLAVGERDLDAVPRQPREAPAVPGLLGVAREQVIRLVGPELAEQPHLHEVVLLAVGLVPNRLAVGLGPRDRDRRTRVRRQRGAAQVACVPRGGCADRDRRNDFECAIPNAPASRTSE
jgi:hypothetical protein